MSKGWRAGIKTRYRGAKHTLRARALAMPRLDGCFHLLVMLALLTLAVPAAPASDQTEVPSQPLTGERRERAKAWLGDPDQILKDNLPGKEVGASCTVTQDCPTGFDCVIAGFEGHCVKL